MLAIVHIIASPIILCVTNTLHLHLGRPSFPWGYFKRMLVSSFFRMIFVSLVLSQWQTFSKIHKYTALAVLHGRNIAIQFNQQWKHLCVLQRMHEQLLPDLRDSSAVDMNEIPDRNLRKKNIHVSTRPESSDWGWKKG